LNVGGGDPGVNSRQDVSGRLQLVRADHGENLVPARDFQAATRQKKGGFATIGKAQRIADV